MYLKMTDKKDRRKHSKPLEVTIVEFDPLNNQLLFIEKGLQDTIQTWQMETGKLYTITKNKGRTKE